MTGAGSGIGRAVALGLAKEGLDVYLAGRKKAKLLITRQESIKEKNKGSCYVIKCINVIITNNSAVTIFIFNNILTHAMYLGIWSVNSLS